MKQTPFGLCCTGGTERAPLAAHALDTVLVVLAVLLQLLSSISGQISHIIREIRQFQQTSYKIEHQPKVWRWPCPEIHVFLLNHST